MIARTNTLIILLTMENGDTNDIRFIYFSWFHLVFVHHILFNRTDGCHLLILFFSLLRSKNSVISKLMDLDPRKSGPLQNYSKSTLTRRKKQMMTFSHISSKIKAMGDSCMQSLFLLGVGCKMWVLVQWLDINSFL